MSPFIIFYVPDTRYSRTGAQTLHNILLYLPPIVKYITKNLQLGNFFVTVASQIKAILYVLLFLRRLPVSHKN